MKVRPKLLTMSYITPCVLVFLTAGCAVDPTGSSEGITSLSDFAIDFIRQIIAALLF